jgi:hypothetical protein
LNTKSIQIEKGISDIVGVFTDPILVFPGGWGDTLPGWLKGAITMERLIENMKALKGEPMTGTDAEACAYLMTVSLTQPIDSDWTQIYLYVAGKVYEKHRTKESGATMPEDIRVDQLSDYQMQHLDRLKGWIYRQRIKVRQERDRADRRERKGAAVAEKDALQPVLFEF